MALKTDYLEYTMTNLRNALIAYVLLGVSEILPIISHLRGTATFQGIVHSLICIVVGIIHTIKPHTTVAPAKAPSELSFSVHIPFFSKKPTPHSPPGSQAPPSPPDTPQYRAHKSNVDPHVAAK